MIGQDCRSGSFYESENANSAVIDRGFWYLNLEYPCSCSGKVNKYEAKHYPFSQAIYTVHIAVWRPRSDGSTGIYDIVCVTIINHAQA